MEKQVEKEDLDKEEEGEEDEDRRRRKGHGKTLSVSEKDRKIGHRRINEEGQVKHLRINIKNFNFLFF